MGRFQCPRCGAIVSADNPAQLVCPNCGFHPGSAPLASVYRPPEPRVEARLRPTVDAPGSYVPSPTTRGRPPAHRWALILGLVTLVIWLIPYIGLLLAFVTAAGGVASGAIALRRNRGGPGRGVAVVGIVLSVFGVLLGVLALVVFLDEFVDLLRRL